MGPRPLARRLEIDAATVQRVLNAVRRDDSEEMAAALPGKQGLRKFIRALERVSGKTLTEARESLDRLEAESDARRSSRGAQVLDHRRAQGKGQADSTLSARRAAFGPTTRIAGYSYDEWMYIHVLMPVKGQPSLMQLLHAVVLGGVGTYDRDVVLPVHMSVSSDALPAGVPGMKVLRNTPTLIGGAVASEHVTVCDASSEHEGEKLSVLKFHAGARDVDVPMAFGSGPVSHPSHDPDPFHVFLKTPRAAVRRLVIDAWVHSSMVLSGVPEVMCVWMQAEVPLTPTALRARRFPIPMSVQIGEGELPRLTARLRSLHGVLTDDLLARTGLPRAEFTRVRAVCAYPLPGFSYALSLEFVRSAADTGEV